MWRPVRQEYYNLNFNVYKQLLLVKYWINYYYLHSTTMIKLLQEIDLSKQLAEEPELLAYINEAAKAVEKEQSEQLLKFKKPVFDEDMENHLIVTNIPDLKGKEEKFIQLFKGFLDKKEIGGKEGLLSLEPGYTVVNNEKVYNKTLYIIYKTASTAKKAYQKLHHLKFDKEHTLACFTVKQFRDVQRISQNYTSPTFMPKQQMIEYNLDDKYRDQFIYTIKDSKKQKLVVKWFDHVEKKIQEAVVGEWSDSLPENTKSVVFSSKGIYIAVCEPEGVRILAGNNFAQKGFFKHEGVTEVAFSPNENYMISHNKSDNARVYERYIIWAVEPQLSLRESKALPHQSLSSFQFNSDESRLAIVLNHQFVVYSCDTIENLKKQVKLSEDELATEGRLIKALNLQKLIWLPDRVSLTCLCYELNPSVNSHPSSKIFTFNTETKEEKKWKAIGLNIKKVEAAVSNNGDWISVSFKKIQKKNSSISVIYIVNLTKRDIETQVLQFKENVVSVSWDRNNGRFGVVYELPSAVKNDDVKFGVRFYEIIVKDKIQQAVKFEEIAETPANRIILAQNGAFFALYNISALSAGKYKYSLGVFVKEQKDKKPTIEIIKQDIEIPYMTYFDMDESGRFILTGTNKTYQIWTTSGEIINKDMFSVEIQNVHFRPRFMTKLSVEAEKKLLEREKEIKKKFQEKDEQRLNKLQFQRKKEKEEKRNQFLKYLGEKREWFGQFKERRDKLRGFDQKDPKVQSARYQYQYLERTGV